VALALRAVLEHKIIRPMTKFDGFIVGDRFSIKRYSVSTERHIKEA
jgi:hypothetical protein